jgi:hypothetical protein
MSEKHDNPYREGLYNKVFGFIKAKQVVTRAQVLEFTLKQGKKEDAANAAVTVLLSPRKTARKNCDPRGNMSAQGHLYYMEKLPRKTVKGEKEAQKFRLRWRTPALEARKRVEKIEVTPAKATKAPAKVEAPKADTTVKA